MSGERKEPAGESVESAMPRCSRGRRPRTKTNWRPPGAGGPGYRKGVVALALALAYACVLVSSAFAAADAAAAPKAESAAKPATIHVKGLGWWRNFELRKSLRLLAPEDAPLTEIDSGFAEDSVVVLQSALERDGFLRPSGKVIFERGGKRVGEFSWNPGEVPVIPRDLRGDEVTFQLEPGVRYLFEKIEFTGLASIDAAAARSYFVEEGFLLGGAASRKFSPSQLHNGVRNLREELVRMGFADAQVEVSSEQRDDKSGAVQVVIAVDEGRPHVVASVAPPAAMPEGVDEEIARRCRDAAGATFSPLWQQDFVQSVRGALYAHGYAKAEAKLEPGATDEKNATVQHTFKLTINAGAQVHVGRVEFSGDDHTHRGILQRAILTHTGDLFDRSDVERDRLRLGDLGVFSSVRADIDQSSDSIWNVNYQLKPAKRIEASVLGGYGSYEQFRGALEVAHTNLFGAAHRGRLLLVESMKSSSGDYLYTIPQIFGTGADASARLFGLKREEVSFDRKEIGASIGLRRRISFLGADASLRYQYENDSATITSDVLRSEVPPNSKVAALTLDLTRDRLDNPITPHRGQFVALTLETAAKEIGGEVGYERLDFRAAWHRQVGREQFVHLGVRQGVLWALGSSASDIPINKRYFPGGEGTVRGYREGRAAPRGPDGTVIGAEVSTVLNLEFEQGLSRQFSAVVFVDAGITGAKLADFPGNQTRVSVGLGLRYNTIIGPARLEYGHNVVKETGDQVGELHFALGFPF